MDLPVIYYTKVNLIGQFYFIFFSVVICFLLYTHIKEEEKKIDVLNISGQLSAFIFY